MVTDVELSSSIHHWNRQLVAAFALPAPTLASSCAVLTAREETLVKLADVGIIHYTELPERVAHALIVRQLPLQRCQLHARHGVTAGETA